MKILGFVGLFLCAVVPADAAFIIYDTNSFQVKGAVELEADVILDDDEAPLEIPATLVSEIVWPPPATCATGALEWTRVTDPGELPLVLNPDLVFFRCTTVTTLQELRMATLSEFNRLVELNSGLGQEISPLAIIPLLIGEIKCAGVGSAQCNDMRSDNNTIFNLVTNAAGVRAIQALFLTLRNEMVAVRDAQCALVPAGPFCP